MTRLFFSALILWSAFVVQLWPRPLLSRAIRLIVREKP